MKNHPKENAIKPMNILITAVVLACFVFAQRAHAVVPAPDGGYPGLNTAEGTNALNSLTTGVGNAAVGWYSLFSNTDGSFNTALGAGTLLFNVGDQSMSAGIQNTAVGTAALLFNTTGAVNTALGALALENNNEGGENTATGAGALQANTAGYFNTASGAFALHENTIGNFNTAIGFNALLNSGTGNNNTAIGSAALMQNSGGGNTAVGDAAGLALTTGNNNVCVGAGVIGLAGESNTTRIRNIGSTPIVGGLNVVIESTTETGAARLGYASSSRRYKQEIKPMDKGSESLFCLKPVTFRAKNNTGDTTHVKHYGLIAEEVATVDPDLVVFNREGKPETLRFDSINAMLLNEFLKEHNRVEELKTRGAQQDATIADLNSTIVQLTKEMEAVVAHAKEQDSKIQKVSAHIQLNKPVAQFTRISH